jgi:hypothetical protein
VGKTLYLTLHLVLDGSCEILVLATCPLGGFCGISECFVDRGPNGEKRVVTKSRPPAVPQLAPAPHQTPEPLWALLCLCSAHSGS